VAEAWRGYTADQVRSAEAPLLAAGVPLMRRAARALADHVLAQPPRPPRGVLVLAGSGDNGGDALFAAAHLARAGVRVAIVRTGSRVHEEALAAALAAGAESVDDALERMPELVARADVILDGMLGIGRTASPALRGNARDAVARILPLLEGTRRPRVVAVDVPSGVHPDDGSVPDPTVLSADTTVCFGAVKAGLLREPAARYAGRIVLVDLGLDLPD